MMKFALILSFIFFTSCKYKLSTYSAETPDQDLNRVNMKRIKAQESSEGANFKIALISDTHNFYKSLDKLIKTINSRGPYSFVIITGDITNLGLLEEYDNSRKFFNRLNYPYLVAAGNHDLIANGDLIFKKMFGKKDFIFSYKDNDFVFFDNNNWENAGNIPDLVWLEKQLIASTGTDLILVAHVPPDDRARFTEQEISDFSNLLTTNNVSYYINGHNHNPLEGSFGNATQITVGAPNKGSYFELIMGPGGITHQKISF